VNGD
jgi:hypothetical protein